MSRADKKHWLGLHVCGATSAQWNAPPRSNRKWGLVPVIGTFLCKCTVLLLYFKHFNKVYYTIAGFLILYSLVVELEEGDWMV